MRSGKATGWDNVPAEAYRASTAASTELFRICRLMWRSERIPEELVRGMCIMLHKKGTWNDYGNYRAICLLCHSYKLLSAVVARRLMTYLEGHIVDTQAGFRPRQRARPEIVHQHDHARRQAIIVFINYTAAFDSESHLFLDEALAEA